MHLKVELFWKPVLVSALSSAKLAGHSISSEGPGQGGVYSEHCSSSDKQHRWSCGQGHSVQLQSPVHTEQTNPSQPSRVQHLRCLETQWECLCVLYVPYVLIFLLLRFLGL